MVGYYLSIMHSEHTIQPLCKLCRANGILKGDIIAETEQAYLVASLYNTSYFLIIPNMHAETVEELPDNWWVAVKELLPHIPNLPKDYNISVNIGQESGQTLKHLHFWVIPRYAGQAASTKGLASLIDLANTPDN